MKKKKPSVIIGGKGGGNADELKEAARQQRKTGGIPNRGSQIHTPGNKKPDRHKPQFFDMKEEEREPISEAEIERKESQFRAHIGRIKGRKDMIPSKVATFKEPQKRGAKPRGYIIVGDTRMHEFKIQNRTLLKINGLLKIMRELGTPTTIPDVQILANNTQAEQGFRNLFHYLVKYELVERSATAYGHFVVTEEGKTVDLSRQLIRNKTVERQRLRIEAAKPVERPVPNIEQAERAAPPAAAVHPPAFDGLRVVSIINRRTQRLREERAQINGDDGEAVAEALGLMIDANNRIVASLLRQAADEIEAAA